MYNFQIWHTDLLDQEGFNVKKKKMLCYSRTKWGSLIIEFRVFLFLDWLLYQG